MINHLRKRNETLTNKQDQYKDALYTLNKEVTELTEMLIEETRQREEEQEAKATLEKELTALLRQVETARADAVTEFKASQPSLTPVPFTMVMSLRTALSRSSISTHTWIYPWSLWTTLCRQLLLATPPLRRPTVVRTGSKK